MSVIDSFLLGILTALRTQGADSEWSRDTANPSGKRKLKKSFSLMLKHSDM